MKTDEKENDTYFTVDIEKVDDQISFFLKLKLIDKNTKLPILPVLWSDNYIYLLPKEKRVLKVKIHNIYLIGKEPELVVDGYNLNTVN